MDFIFKVEGMEVDIVGFGFLAVAVLVSTYWAYTSFRKVATSFTILPFV